MYASYRKHDKKKRRIKFDKNSLRAKTGKTRITSCQNRDHRNNNTTARAAVTTSQQPPPLHLTTAPDSLLPGSQQCNLASRTVLRNLQNRWTNQDTRSTREACRCATSSPEPLRSLKKNIPYIRTWYHTCVVPVFRRYWLFNKQSTP